MTGPHVYLDRDMHLFQTHGPERNRVLFKMYTWPNPGIGNNVVLVETGYSQKNISGLNQALEIMWSLFSEGIGNNVYLDILRFWLKHNQYDNEHGKHPIELRGAKEQDNEHWWVLHHLSISGSPATGRP